MIQKIRDLKQGETVWDKDENGSVKGLHVRCLPNGKKVFLLYYRTRSGQQRRPKVGDFPQLTLADARRMAKAILEPVAAGRDPKGEWDEAKAEMTIQELYDATMAGHWAKGGSVDSGWAKEVGYLYKNHLQVAFGSKRLSQVTPPVIRAWLAGYDDAIYAGNRALSVLGRMFTYAEQQELRPQGVNPCKLVKSWPERSRDRFASDAEIKKLAPVLEREAKLYPEGVAFIYLLLFTGSRPRAIERATWDQLTTFESDGEVCGLLRFEGKSSSKTGEQERVLVPAQAMKLISSLPRAEGGRIVNIDLPRKLWNRIRIEAGCPDLWARDLRRTFATVGMSEGVPMDTIGGTLNHHTRETTAVYAKLADKTRIDAVTKIANRMEVLLKTKTILRSVK